MDAHPTPAPSLRSYLPQWYHTLMSKPYFVNRHPKMAHPPCVSGVAGANLKKPIARSRSKRLGRKLNFSGKLLLAVAAVLAVAIPMSFGLTHTTKADTRSQSQGSQTLAPTFEVASIKINRSGERGAAIKLTPGRLVITNFKLHMLIRTAYMVQDNQISGEPNLLNADGYDIEAKIDPAVDDQLTKLAPGQRNLQIMHMLQSLLEDRFRLALHHETKDLPIYALVIAKDGPKIKEAKPGDTYPNGPTGLGGRPIGGGTLVAPERGKLIGQGVPLSRLTQTLTDYKFVDRSIIDKTNLSGNYDFTLQWAQEIQLPTDNTQDMDRAPSLNESGPSIFTAIQAQLGLKLESQKAPVDMLVIDHVEKPSAN
jgi:bla regulator protein blaR1